MSFFRKNSNKSAPSIASRSHSLAFVPQNESEDEESDIVVFKNTEHNSRSEPFDDVPVLKKNNGRFVSFLESVEVIGYIDDEDDSDSDEFEKSDHDDEIHPSHHSNTSLQRFQLPQLQLQQPPAERNLTSVPLIDTKLNLSMNGKLSPLNYFSFVDSFLNDEAYLISTEPISKDDAPPLALKVTDTLLDYTPEIKITAVEPKIAATMTPLHRSSGTGESSLPLEVPKIKRKVRHVQIQVHVPFKNIAIQTDPVQISENSELQAYVTELEERLENEKIDRFEMKEQLQNQVNSLTTELLAERKRCSELEKEVNAVKSRSAELFAEMEAKLVREQHEKISTVQEIIGKEELMNRAYLQMKRLLLEKEAMNLQIDYLYAANV